MYGRSSMSAGSPIPIRYIVYKNAKYPAADKLRGCRAGPDAEDTDTIGPIFQQIGCRANTGGTKGLSQRYLSRQRALTTAARAGQGLAGPEGPEQHHRH